MLQRKSAARSKPTLSARKAALPLLIESSLSGNCASGRFEVEDELHSADFDLRSHRFV
jgi:hypothetical protein